MRTILTLIMTLILSCGYSQTKDSPEIYSERLNEQLEILKMHYDSMQIKFDSLDMILSEFDNYPLVKMLNENFDYDSLYQEYLVYKLNHSGIIPCRTYIKSEKSEGRNPLRLFKFIR